MYDDMEIEEARKEIENSIELIDYTLEKIKSAKDWGLLDIIGGEGLSSFIKRKRIKEINENMKRLEKQLVITKKELEDVEEELSYRIPDSFTNRLFDIFLDNIFTDINTQNKLKTAEKNLIGLKNKLEEILHEL